MYKTNKTEEKAVASRATVHRRLREFGLSGGARRKLREQINSLLGAFDSGAEASLARVLNALYPNGTEQTAQGNFRAFKRRFNETLRDNGVPLELASSRGTTSPEKRFAWFWDLAPADADLRLGVSTAAELTARALARAPGTPLLSLNSYYPAGSLNVSLIGNTARRNSPANSAAPAFIPPDVYATLIPCVEYREEMAHFFHEFFPAEWRKYSGSRRRFLSGLTAKLEPIRRLSPHPDTPHEVAGFESLAFDAEGRSYTGIAHFARELGVIPAVWQVGLLYASLLTIRRIAVTFPLEDADIHIDRVFFAMNLDPRMLASPALKTVCAVYRGVFPGRFYFEVKETFPKGMAAAAREFFEETGFRYALDDVDEADPAVRHELEGGAALVKIGYKRSKPLLEQYSTNPEAVLAELRAYKMKGKPLVVEALDEDVRQMFLYDSWKEEWGELLAQGRDLDAGPFYGRHLVPLKRLGITGGGFALPADAPEDSQHIFSPGGNSCSNGKTAFIYEKQSAQRAVCNISPLNSSGDAPQPAPDSFHSNDETETHPIISEQPEQQPNISHIQKAGVPAMNLLLRWAGALQDTEDRIEEHFPAVVALLGGAGSGKTALCRAFAAELLRLSGANNPAGAASPVPALIEIGPAVAKLRAAIERGDAPGAIETAAYFTESLGMTNFPAAALLRAVASGRVILIIDGPEEVAARASRPDAMRYLSALGSAVTKHCANRMLISCRDTYFLSSEDELEKLPGGAEPVYETPYGGAAVCEGGSARNSTAAWMPSPMIIKLAPFDPDQSREFIMSRTAASPVGEEDKHKGNKGTKTQKGNEEDGSAAQTDESASAAWERGRPARILKPTAEPPINTARGDNTPGAQIAAKFWNRPELGELISLPAALEYATSGAGREEKVERKERIRKIEEDKHKGAKAQRGNDDGSAEDIAAQTDESAPPAWERGSPARILNADPLAGFIRSTAAKDAAKNLLRPDIALELLERLAIELYKTRRQTIHAGELYRWFRREAAAEFPAAASEETIEALETNFRLSPFLRRDNDGQFSFISPAIAQHFTARSIARRLSLGDIHSLNIPALNRQTVAMLTTALQKPPFSATAALAAVQKHLRSGYILGDTDFSKNIVLFLDQYR